MKKLGFAKKKMTAASAKKPAKGTSAKAYAKPPKGSKLEDRLRDKEM